MNPIPKPKIEHKPANRAALSPRKPVLAPKTTKPGVRPPQAKKPFKPRKKPLADEIDEIVREAAALGTPGGHTTDNLLANVVKALTKRLHGVRMPAAVKDRRAKRLPAGSEYTKHWNGTEWCVMLMVGGSGATFMMNGNGSFRTEELCNNLYLKWVKAQEAKPACSADSPVGSPETSAPSPPPKNSAP